MSSYPFESQSQERVYGAHVSSPAFTSSSPWSHHDPIFASTANPFSSGARRISRGYEPLNGPYPDHEPQRPAAREKPSTIFQWIWWLPEIFASLLACACLCAIVVVLRVYDGRSLASIVLPASLTLNGVIAAMSTLARVALMVPVGSALSQESWLWFSADAHHQHRPQSRLRDLELVDAASRGAWGSLVFLVRGRGRLIAYVGTILTIVSLAFGTATQQLLSVDKYDVTDVALLPRNLPRAETWQYYDSVPSEEAPTPPFSVRAAMYNGFLRDKVDPVAVTCATGNCTWPTTPSLAVCGACSDSSYTMTCNETACTYRMPSGNNISLTNTGDEGIGFAVEPSVAGAVFNRSVGDRPYLVNFDFVGATYMSLAQGFNNSNTPASECALWVCIQSFSASMVAGSLHENVTMSFHDLIRPEDDNMQPFDNYTFASLPAEMNPDPDVTYNVSYIGLYSLGAIFYSMCRGTAFLDIESSSASSDTIDAIWYASSNPDPWIRNLATSITNAIRYDDINPVPPSRQPLVPAPNRATYDGTSFELGVRVQWPWLILPVFCVFGAILLLVSVMVQTARSPVLPWKASLLTLLFFEVDPILKQRAVAGMKSWSGVYNAVGDSRVVLKQDGGGNWAMKVA